MTLAESVYKRLLEFAYENNGDISTVEQYADKICDDFNNVINSEEFAKHFHFSKKIKED